MPTTRPSRTPPLRLAIATALLAWVPLGAVPSRATITQRVDSARITLSYSRPSLEGRSIFGSIVPFNRVWRSTEGEAAFFATDQPLLFSRAGVLSKGKYSVFMQPGESRWYLIFNHQTGQWASEYHPERNALKVPGTVSATDLPREQLTFIVSDLENSRDGGAMTFEWDRVSVRWTFSIARKEP